VDISLGSVCNLHEEVSKALEPCCEEIKQALAKQDILNVTRRAGRAWARDLALVFVAPAMTFFTLAASREQSAQGSSWRCVWRIICSDMFSAYNAYHKGKGRSVGHISSGPSKGSNMRAGAPMA